MCTWPRKGLCAFWEYQLHPAVPLFTWIAAVIGVQFVSYWGLGVIVFVVAITAFHSVVSFINYLWRARWLLAALWLVIAFNTPGDAFHDIAWAPTYEGVAAANLQAARLIVTLACLGWLFTFLSGDRLLLALSGLMLPLNHLGVDANRIIVRLSLVLEQLESPVKHIGWREMLLDPTGGDGSRTMISLTMPPWRLRDSAALMIISTLFVGSLIW